MTTCHGVPSWEGGFIPQWMLSVLPDCVLGQDQGHHPSGARSVGPDGSQPSLSRNCPLREIAFFHVGEKGREQPARAVQVQAWGKVSEELASSAECKTSDSVLIKIPQFYITIPSVWIRLGYVST